MSKIAPPRFMIFLVLLVVGIGLFVWLWHPLKGIMAGFDIAAATFGARDRNRIVEAGELENGRFLHRFPLEKVRVHWFHE